MLYTCSNRDIKARKSPLDNLFENEIGGAVKGCVEWKSMR
jgi:hypothetical protein